MADSSPLAHSPTLQAGAPRIPGDDEQLAAGTAVGDYVIERFIGAGAMGEVYAGRHPVIGKRVAIKLLRLELAASAEAAERFIREARAVNQIEHENVVDVFAFGRMDDGRLYLVMDLVEGKSLRAHLVDGPLDIASALDILETIASALDAAHARGVVHRDLKPDNIVLSKATPPKVMVLDFGIAKLISTANEGKPTGPGTLTGAGTWLGTPGYMAPEQWSVDGAGPASDRYALGVIAFELLAGALPFSATSVPAMMEQHFRAQVPALSARGAVGVPVAVDSVLKKALAKDPDARYATGREMVAALREAAGPNGKRARGAVAPPEVPRKLWVPALAGAAVLGAGALVVVLARDDGQTTGETPRPNARVTAPSGSVTVDVISTPNGAEVKGPGGIVATTPAQIIAQPGDKLDLVVRKPGYLSEHRTVTAGPSGTVVTVALGEVMRFEGVWRLGNGELRAFKRRGDEVDVYKLAELDGERTFFKQYRFGLADHGVAFGGEDVVIDPRAPNDPRCHIRMRVDYQYDPMHDVLEQRREKVKIDFHDGGCVVRSRDIEPTKLARMDTTHDTHEISAPVGVPIAKTPPTKAPPEKAPPEKVLNQKSPPTSPAQKKAVAKQKVLPLDPKAELLEEQRQKANVTKKPTQTYTAPKNASSGAGQNLSPPPQAQLVPQPSAPPPQANEPMPQAVEPVQSKQRK